MKLEIGPGPKKISSEWITVGDFERPNVVDHVCLWGKDPLPFNDSTFNYIYSSHCLEHVPWYQVDFAISECFRVMKPNGIIEIHVPNLEYLIECYNEKKLGDTWKKHNNREHYVSWFASRMISYGPTSSNHHKSCFDYEYLSYLLSKHGFKYIKSHNKGAAKSYHGNINMGVLAKKP